MIIWYIIYIHIYIYYVYIYTYRFFKHVLYRLYCLIFWTEPDVVTMGRDWPSNCRLLYLFAWPLLMGQSIVWHLRRGWRCWKSARHGQFWWRWVAGKSTKGRAVGKNWFLTLDDLHSMVLDLKKRWWQEEIQDYIMYTILFIYWVLFRLFLLVTVATRIMTFS